MHNQKPDMPRNNTGPDELQEALHQLLQQISVRDQKISWIDAMKTAMLRDFQAERDEREAVLLYTQGQLREKEAQLDEIINSRAWKITSFFRGIRASMFPPDSRRSRILERALRMVFFPFEKTKRK